MLTMYRSRQVSVATTIIVNNLTIPNQIKRDQFKNGAPADAGGDSFSGLVGHQISFKWLIKSPAMA